MNTTTQQPKIQQTQTPIITSISNINSTQKTNTPTPLIRNFYYAVMGGDGLFSVVQLMDSKWHNHDDGRREQWVKISQYGKTFTVLPDFLIPNQLGEPVAQFWLPLDEFASWRLILMQRGVGDIKL